MKTKVHRSISNVGFIFLMLLSMFLCGCGCNTSKPTPDPLLGWQMDFNQNKNATIENDYQNYIHSLSPEEKQNLGPYPASYFEDGTGQHAIRIRIGINHKVWQHILIYDKGNNRIKTIKYVSGDYHS